MPKDKHDIQRDIYRWLRGQVGRAWDKVNAEMRSMFDARSEAGHQTVDRADVSVNCILDEDGTVVESAASNGKRRAPWGLYVHPKTGLLCDSRTEGTASRRKRLMKHQQQAVIDRIRLDNQRNYELIDGIWYRKMFEFHGPAEIWKIYRFDPSNERQSHQNLRKPGDTHTVYYHAVPHLARIERGKFQCSKEELIWIHWFLDRARAGKLQVKWIFNQDRINGVTAALQVKHLPTPPPGRVKRVKDARLPHQGHPAPVVHERVEVPKGLPEKIFQEIVLPVVHRTVF